MKNTSIEWCDHTWNPWRGCTRVERALDCVNCYAATMGHRFGIEWGPHGIRVESSERTWREPFRWAKHLKWEGGYRHPRVFALSMGDWLEDEPKKWSPVGQPVPYGGIPTSWLARMLDTIRQTPTLNWILLTKRPENFERRIYDVGNSLLVPSGMRAKNKKDAPLLNWLKEWIDGNPPKNVCVMTSVGYQKAADERIPHLLRIPARWRGLSLEPLLESVDLTKIPMGDGRTWSLTGTIDDNGWPESRLRPLHLLIIGGESGHGARPCNVRWIRDIRDQGELAGCPVFVKQLGARPFDSSQSADRLKRFSVKGTWKDGVFWPELKNPKGGDPSEWSEDLRVREWPCGL